MNNRNIKKARFRSMTVLLAGFFTILSTVSLGQDTLRLSLKDALNYALKANQQAKKAILDVENSEYRIDEVRSRALPQINGSGTLTYNPMLQKSALPNIFGPNPNPDETILVAFGQKWNAMGGISLSQNLFDKSVLTGLDAARTTREFYKLSASLTEDQVIEQVATAYYQVLVQRQQMILLDSTIRNTSRVLNILKGQYDNGLAKKIDVDRVTVNISNLNSQRQQMLNGIALLENQLKFYMGMPIQTPVRIPEAEIDEIRPNIMAINDSVDFTSRLEYKVLKSQEQLYKYQKEAYKAEYYPSLSLSGNYSYMGLGNKMPVFKGQNSGVNWFGVSSVGLSLKVPIFNGFATRSRIRQADISLKKLNEDIEQTKLSLDLANENAKTQIKNSIITLSAQEKNRELALEVFNNTQNNYNNGLATLTDLLNAETSLTEANNNFSAALLNYRVAEIQLIKSQGNLKSLIN